MKNRFIYVLITLMVIALVGIISIQTIWIKDSIDERRKELATHVNDALNGVNDDIREEESMFILRQRFGDVDSLMNSIVLNKPKNQKIEIRFDHDSLLEDGDKFIVISDSAKDVSIDLEGLAELEALKQLENLKHLDGLEGLEDLADSMESLGSRMEALDKHMNQWGHDLEVKLQRIDSNIAATIEQHDLDQDHMEHISNIVEHYTFEMLLSDELEDRIKSEDLQKKIRLALKKEGVHNEFEYAVYDAKSDSIVQGFKSEGFDLNKKLSSYNKQLFEDDRHRKNQFQLYVQLNGMHKYLWGGIWGLTTLSVLFTLLIIFAFWYALHLIYKQKKISQIKNDFINNMTHELKTPLASISLAASSIKHPQVIGDPKEIEKFADIIDSEKTRIKSHIDRVLEMAALDSGDLKLKLEEVDLNDIVQTAIKNVGLSIQEAGGEIHFSPSATNLKLSADRFHLTNVITNILDNSIKYRRENLEINITITEKDNKWLVIIRDNGMGMKGEEQKLAFDKFYRAETGDVHNIKGFGLGLSYVKNIIEKHQGEVNLSSKQGEGTTVSISIPKHG